MPVPSTEEEREQRIDLRDGGLVAVMLGRGHDISVEYADHPQVRVVDLSKSIFDVALIERELPSNTRGVIITDQMPRETHVCLKSVVTRRRLPYLIRRNKRAIDAALENILPFNGRAATAAIPEQVAALTEEPGALTATLGETAKRKIAPHGALRALVETEADLSATTSIQVEARRLMRLAQERGIPTTIGSLEQAIRVRKRKGGLGARPASAAPLSEHARVMKVLETAIGELQTVLDYVKRVEDENSTLKAKFELLQETFAKLETLSR